MQKQIESLRRELKDLKSKRFEEAKAIWKQNSRSSSNSNGVSFHSKQAIKGSFGKVTHVKWGLNNEILTASSGAQTVGAMILWNSVNAQKRKIIVPTRTWMMAVAVDIHGRGNLVASGGLENILSIYNTSTEGIMLDYPEVELKRHEGYISDCCFVADGSLLTGAGDHDVMKWDISREVPSFIFSGHTSDVTSVKSCPVNPDQLVSGSVDKTAKIWDTRQKKAAMTFDQHTLDVNAVDYFPDGYSVGTGSDDGISYLFDLRAAGPVQMFTRQDAKHVGIQKCLFSSSGRFLFTLDTSNQCYAFDLSSYDPDRMDGIYRVNNSSAQVSCIDVHPAGYALALGDVHKGPKDALVSIYSAA